MLTLLIDAMSVNLSAGSSFEFYDRNPLFSKEGQHTLDIDIDLGDPQNAYVYHDMHRIDCPRRPSGRAAVLFSEKGIVIKGTEIVLEIDEKKAKIQIVSGNSELNYLSGGDQTLHSLELGSTPELTPEVAMQSLTPGTYDFVCSPVCVKNTFTMSGTMMGVDGDDTLYNEMFIGSDGQAKYVDGTILNPMPYLYAVVERVVQALGYTMKANFIREDPALSKLVVINGYHSQNYAEMMPNMLVDDFLTMVENFTGCVIVVDQAEKKVEILQKNFFYDNAEEEVVDSSDIIGDIQRKYDEDSPENLLYNNVSYDFPKTETYNYWSIDKELWKTLLIEDCPDHSSEYTDPVFKEHFMNCWRYMNDGVIPTRDGSKDAIIAKYNRSVVYRDKAYNDNNLVVLRAIDNKDKPTVMLIRIVNQYGGHYDERSENEMKLKVVPTEIVWWMDPMRTGIRVFLPMPFARQSDIPDTEATDSNEKGLNEFINEGAELDNMEERLFVGFYLGKKNCNWKYNATRFIYFPVVVPSNVVEARTHAIYGPTYEYQDSWGSGRWWTYPYFLRVARHDYGEPLCNMQILGETGMYNRYYKNTLNINFTQPVTIKFRSLDLRDSRKIFIIGNQRFFCAELKHRATANAVSEVIEGTFYQVLDNADEALPQRTITITAKVYQKEGCIVFLSSESLPCDVSFAFIARSSQSVMRKVFTMQKGTRTAYFYSSLMAFNYFAFDGDITPAVDDGRTTYTTEVVPVQTKEVYVSVAFLASTEHIGGTIDVRISEVLEYPIEVEVGYSEGTLFRTCNVTIGAGTSRGTTEISELPDGEFTMAIMRTDDNDTNRYLPDNAREEAEWAPPRQQDEVVPDDEE